MCEIIIRLRQGRHRICRLMSPTVSMRKCGAVPIFATCRNSVRMHATAPLTLHGDSRSDRLTALSASHARVCNLYVAAHFSGARILYFARVGLRENPVCNAGNGIHAPPRSRVDACDQRCWHRVARVSRGTRTHPPDRASAAIINEGLCQRNTPRLLSITHALRRNPKASSTDGCLNKSWQLNSLGSPAI